MTPPDALFSPEELLVEGMTDRPGGQHVGVCSGVKITHLPSGMVAIAQSDRSQHRNRLIAMDMILGGLTSPHFKGAR